MNALQRRQLPNPYRGRFGRKDPDATAAVDRALALTGVTDLAERGADHLSGGRLQRVWLAGCLAQEAGVLLLDEPTTYLDLRYRIELLDLVCDLADDQGIAVGVVVHEWMSFARRSPSSPLSASRVCPRRAADGFRSSLVPPASPR